MHWGPQDPLVSGGPLDVTPSPFLCCFPWENILGAPPTPTLPHSGPRSSPGASLGVPRSGAQGEVLNPLWVSSNGTAVPPGAAGPCWGSQPPTPPVTGKMPGEYSLRQTKLRACRRRVEKNLVSVFSPHPELWGLSGEVEAAPPWQTNLHPPVRDKKEGPAGRQPGPPAADPVPTLQGLSQISSTLMPLPWEACLKPPPRAQTTHLTSALVIRDAKGG